MSWLVTGAGGQLGSHAVAQLRAAGDEQVIALTRAELDITDADAVDDVIARQRPDVVLNAAAYTKVDAAEADEAAAERVNGTGPRVLAEALARRGGQLLHVSTDYVFAGDAARPYEPGDAVGPRTAYGRTKLAGERAVRSVLPQHAHVIRSAWVFGGPGPNFVDTMLRLERERDTLDVVDDQVGNPTWAGDLAAALLELGRAGVPGGVWHVVNGGQASWFDLACETFRLAGADPERVRPTDSLAMPRPAPRPAWSVLATTGWERAGFAPLRPWREALAACLRERGAEDTAI